MIKILLPLLLAQWTTQGIRVLDEGAVKGYATQVNCLGPITCTSNGTIWTINAAGGSGAPTDAKYLVMAADATLTQEVVVPTCTGSDVLTSNGTVISCTTPGGGGTPGGSDTQVQFNDGGAFGGDAGLTYNKTTDTLTVVGGFSVGGIKVLGPAPSGYAADLALQIPTATKIYYGAGGAVVGSDATGNILRLSGPASVDINSALNLSGTGAAALKLTNAPSYIDLLSLNSGTDGIKMATGNRLHLGTGTNDYLYSDGTGIQTPGRLYTGIYRSSATAGTAAMGLYGTGIYWYDAGTGTTASTIFGTGANWENLVLTPNTANGGVISLDGTTTLGTNTITSSAATGFIGNASTATALAADPTNCSAGQAPLGVDASGNVQGCFTPGGGSPGHAITDEGGAALTTQPTLNFVGAAVTATNDGANSRTNVTIPWPALTNVRDPTGDWTATFPSGTKALWTFTGSTDSAFSIHGDGAFTGTGDLVHINKTGTGAAAGSDALHVEVTSDTNMTGLRITMPTAVDDALITNAVITAPLFSGNATTATALAANGTDCSAGQAPTGVDASGNATGCFTPGGGSGSPGGSTTQIQYNNAGSFGGVSNVTTDGADLTLVGRTTHPSAPAAGSVTAYAFQHRGASGPTDVQFADGATTYDTSIFPFTRGDDAHWGCVLPGAWNSATMTPTGSALAGSATGTAGAVAWASTNEYTRNKWVNFPQASNAVNLNAGLRANVDYVWRGNAAGIGGFYWWGSFAINTTDNTSRLFVGLKDATAVLTATADPSAALDTVYFGCNNAQTTMRVCSNDNSGAATCTDLGANYPCTTTDTAYDVAFWAAPNGSSIGYWIRRYPTAFETSGTISTDLPRNTVQLGWDFTRNTGGTADAIAAMRFGGTCWTSNP